MKQPQIAFSTMPSATLLETGKYSFWWYDEPTIDGMFYGTNCFGDIYLTKSIEIVESWSRFCVTQLSKGGEIKESKMDTEWNPAIFFDLS